jgi:drug/metabolite transporter (DMT)-like permease
MLLAMIGWGMSWVSVKILGRYINEYEMILFRFGITAVTMIPIIGWMKHSFRITLRELGIVLLASLSFFAYMKYFFLGVKLGTASLGGAFVTTMIPIMTFVLLALMGTKKVTRRELTALVLGGIGVMTILGVWNRSLEEILVIHNLYFVLAAFLWAILTIVSSKNRTLSVLVFTFYLYVITVGIDLLFFIDISAIDLQRFDSIFWIHIGLISLLSTTFANTVYFIGIEKLGAGEVSSFVFLVPFAAIGLSIPFLGEEISVWMIAGTVMTLFAVKILNKITLVKKK